MRIVTRYLFKEALVNAGLGLLLFTFVLFIRDVGRLLDIVVRNNSVSILSVFLYALPTALAFTIPMSVLVGLLLGLGRLGSDSELTALRAAGFSRYQLARPLVLLSGLSLVASLVVTLWLAPRSTARLLNLGSDIGIAPALVDLQPRVFFETIPNLVIYVGDIGSGGKGWRDLFIADTRDPQAPRITMARQGGVIDRGHGYVQFHLEDGTSYETRTDQPDRSLISSFSSTDLPLQVPGIRRSALPLSARGTGELWRWPVASTQWRAARIEFHRRFALAFACMALALLGIPLGLESRRGGKSGGFVITLTLVFVYYIVFYLGIALARQGRLLPWVGVWGANLLFIGYGLWRLHAADHVPRSRGTLGIAARLRIWMLHRIRRFTTPQPLADQVGALERPRARQFHWPTLIDSYVIRTFVGYVGLLLASFLVLVLVFTFFDLVGDILRTRTGLVTVLEYLLYLSPQMLYLTIPVAILVGVLITFGLMSKHNEITALKSCGVSLYRLIVPVLIVASLLCGLQFALDSSFLPDFNRRQDALRNLIKGRPAQTFQSPERKWMFGQGNDLYYFQFFDPGKKSFASLTLLRFDPASFRLTERLYARSAHWDSQIDSWVLENGWMQRITQGAVSEYEPFLVASFPEMKEKPAYFLTESRQGSQMDFWELRRYIHDLQHSGYDVARLTVDLQKKIAYPLITVVMALLAFPFALSTGRRGTLSGMALALGLAITYWVAAGLLEALGGLNQLPPLLAAWSPDLLFAVASAYLLLRVPS